MENESTQELQGLDIAGTQAQDSKQTIGSYSPGSQKSRKPRPPQIHSVPASGWLIISGPPVSIKRDTWPIERLEHASWTHPDPVKG